MRASQRALPLALLMLLSVQAAAVLLGPCAGPAVRKPPRPGRAGGAAPAERLFWELPLDIDLAGVRDLVRIPGMGEKRARRVVRWRRDHGPIADPRVLTAIPGMGEKTVELLEKACLGESRSGARAPPARGDGSFPGGP